MEVYDKISWQVDGGVQKKDAITHFRFFFNWLSGKNLLSELGRELFESGIDGSFSLSDNDLNEDGSAFVKAHYDEYISKIQYGVNEQEELLNEIYNEWRSSKK